jgi:hypothetical protein
MTTAEHQNSAEKTLPFQIHKNKNTENVICKNVSASDTRQRFPFRNKTRGHKARQMQKTFATKSATSVSSRTNDGMQI